MFTRNWHFETIGRKLDSVFSGQHPTNNIIFNMPPRSGKTELSIINFIAKGFAVNPASQFIHLSTSDSLVTRNVTNIRKIMECEQYRLMFPDTVITNNAKGSISTTAGGVLYSAPFLGQITGFGCGVMGAERFSGALVIDDPMKTQDALSETIREKYNFTWANTIISRKNDERTPVIITAQRVHEHDLCGMLIDSEGTVEEGGRWDVVKFPAIMDEGLETERSIWEERYTLDYLKRQRELDKWVFETQYMQNPKPIEGTLFPESETKYFSAMEEPDFVLMQIDPADTGKDCYSSKVYFVKDREVYVMDAIYTTDNVDIVMPRQMEQIRKWKPSVVNVESNSAWRLVGKDIRNRCAELGLSTNVRLYNQSANKETRIFNEAPAIRRSFHYLLPEHQNKEYRDMMKEKHNYLKMVRDQRDDGVDTDAAASAYLKRMNIIDVV